MKNFFIADTHFFHHNIIKYEDRPFLSINEMNKYMINEWNKKVSKNDNVYILGDFSFGEESETINLLNSLNGNKYLIMGNHDKITRKESVRKCFKWIKDYYVLKINDLKVILFHYPIQVWDCKHHNSIHLYGHIHSNKDNHHPMINELKNAYNVGVDVNNYQPIEFDEILQKLNYK